MSNWSDDLTWQGYGVAWNQEPSSASTSQAQSVAATGGVSVSGAAATTQGQSIAAMGRQVTAADGVTMQGQTASASGALVISDSPGFWSDTRTWLTQERWGSNNKFFQRQELAATSFDVWYGFLTSASQQSAILNGAVIISGAATTSQTVVEQRNTGTINEQGAARTNSGRQTLRGAARQVISGVARTATSTQTNHGFGSVIDPVEFRPSMEKLLRYPHRAVFDTSAISSAVIRFDDYDGDLKWRISESVLEVDFGGIVRYFDLAGATVAQVVERLRMEQISAQVVDSDFSPLSGMVLVADGTDFRSDRDPIYGFSSLLWVLFYAYAKQVALARYQTVQALRQMVITQAGDEWLDLWGTLYSVDREAGERDRDYAPRIPREAFRLRVNALAIEQAIFDATGWDVRIEEPWKEIFTLDVSLLSGPDRLYDGGRIGYHLIRPVSRETVDWVKVLGVINRNRAAGVLVVEAESRRTTVIDAGGVYEVETAVNRQHAVLLPYQDRVFLDYSDIEDVPVPNHPAIYRGLDGQFRRTLVPYIDAVTIDNGDIEDVAVANNPAIIRRDFLRFSASTLSPLPTATSRHVSKDENEYHLSGSVYEDRHLLDFAEIEREAIPVYPALRKVEITRRSESMLRDGTWDVVTTWNAADANWLTLRSMVEVRASRSS